MFLFCRRIFVAQQAVGCFVLFDLGEAAHGRIEAVVIAVIVALTHLAQKNSAGTGLDLKIMIHILLDADALAGGSRTWVPAGTV